MFDYIMTITAHPTLERRERELSILAVGAHFGSAYELYAHKRVGRMAGLSQIQVKSASEGLMPPDLNRWEQAAFTFSQRLVSCRGSLPDNEFDEATAVLGKERVLILSHLVSAYSFVCIMLNAGAIGVPVDPLEEDEDAERSKTAPEDGASLCVTMDGSPLHDLPSPPPSPESLHQISTPAGKWPLQESAASSTIAGDDQSDEALGPETATAAIFPAYQPLDAQQTETLPSHRAASSSSSMKQFSPIHYSPYPSSRDLQSAHWTHDEFIPPRSILDRRSNQEHRQNPPSPHDLRLQKSAILVGDTRSYSQFKCPTALPSPPQRAYESRPRIVTHTAEYMCRDEHPLSATCNTQEEKSFAGESPKSPGGRSLRHTFSTLLLRRRRNTDLC